MTQRVSLSRLLQILAALSALLALHVAASSLQPVPTPSPLQDFGSGGTAQVQPPQIQVADQQPSPQGQAANQQSIPQAQAANQHPISLPPLGYGFDALAPFISSQTMQLHWGSHHKAYVDSANVLLAGLPQEIQALSPEVLVTMLQQLPDDKRTGLRNNVGGHINHSLFWKLLKLGTQPSGDLLVALERDFGSLERFKQDFETAAKSRFGSGWAWLVMDPNQQLKVCSTANQDNPLMGEEIAGCAGFPIIGLDVWEHAFMLDHPADKPSYIKNFWNVLNWDFAEQRFQEALRHHQQVKR